MKKAHKLLLLLLPALVACGQKHYNADLLVKNARVYTVDSAFTTVEAFVVTGGRILETGTTASLQQKYTARQVFDAGGQTIVPGFIDAHTHFYNFGLSLENVNLQGLKSWRQVTDSVYNFAKFSPDGWLLGQGWDQSLWKSKKFPDKTRLDSLFPDRPVLLTRIDGHAAIANQVALNIAGFKPGQKIEGGLIETVKGKLTGLVADKALDMVTRKIPPADEEAAKTALTQAQHECFAYGLTTVDDCGLDYATVNTIEGLQNNGTLKMRMYLMLNDKPENYNYLFKRGIITKPMLTVRAFKIYADGAMGTRGACLLKPYADQKNWRGFMLCQAAHLQQVAQTLYQKGMQLCVHAVGDSAVRLTLNTFASQLKGKNDKRWRVEHTDVVNPTDVKLFGQYSVVPSVQPANAVASARWVAKRLGNQRFSNAYNFVSLLNQNGWIPLGTDFPDGERNPLATFYAAVERRDFKPKADAAYLSAQNALSRKQALRGITIWPARANFEEDVKGSIEPGKYADFVVLNKDIMKVNRKDLTHVKVLKTYINGEMVYGQN